MLLFFVFSVALASLNLTILHTGDVNGQVLPVNSYNSGCALADALANNRSDCTGGVARHTTYVKQVRATTNNTIVVDTGNFFFGSLFYARFQGAGQQRWFNYINYDVCTLNVQDFWAGQNPVADFISYATGLRLEDSLRPDPTLLPKPILSNFYVYNTSVLYKQIQPWAVLQRDGQYIGFVGAMDVLLQSHSNSGTTTAVNKDADTMDSIRLAIAQIKHEVPECQIIVFLSATNDQSLDESIAKTIYEIDIIIQSNRMLRTRDSATAPYPQVIENLLGNKVLLVSSGSQGAHIGHLNVSFNDEGVITWWEGDAVALTNAYEDDPSVWSQIIIANGQVEEFKQQNVGRTAGSIDGDRGSSSKPLGCGYTDCPAGKILTISQQFLCADCDFAIQNAGGINDGIEITNPDPITGLQNVTLGDLLRVYPFQNTMATFSLKGSFIPLVLQNAVDRSAGDGSFLQITGLRYVYNPNVNLTERIVQVEVWDKDNKVWSRIGSNVFYKVAANSWMRSGGDGFAVIAENAFNINDYLPQLDQVIVQYLNVNPVIRLPTLADYTICSQTVEELAQDPEKQLFIWPKGYENCSVIKTMATQNVLGICQTNRPLCQRYINTSESPFEGYSLTGGLQSCDGCSGMGICFQQVCTCDVPTQGLFAGKTMIQGPDCSVVRHEMKLSSAGYIGLSFLCFTTIVIAFLCSAAYFYYRDMKSIKRSSPLFLHFVSFGGILGAVGVLLSLQSPSVVICNAYLCFLGIAFVTMYGSLFAKTYRIYRIFVVSQIFLRKVKDSDVLRIVGVLVVCEVAIFCVFMIPDPLAKDSTLLTSSFAYSFSCNSGSLPKLLGVLLSFDGALLVWGVYLALKIRNVDRQINESRILGVCIYNISVSVLLIVPVIIILSNTSPTDSLILQAILANYIIMFTLLVTFIPKYLVIARGDGNKDLDMFAAWHHSQEQSEVGSMSEGEDENSMFSFRGTQDIDDLPIPAQITAIRSRLKKAKALVSSLQHKLQTLEQKAIAASSSIPLSAPSASSLDSVSAAASSSSVAAPPTPRESVVVDLGHQVGSFIQTSPSATNL